MMRRHAAAGGTYRKRTFRIRIPLTSAITVGALALASIASGIPAASASASASARVPSAVKADMNELLKSVNPNTGTIGTYGWQAAVAQSTLETYQQTTGDTSYELLPFFTYLLNRSGAFEDNFDDDTAWWGLAWLQYYDITRAPLFLQTAETDANYIHQDWDSTCGGGVWWQRSPHYYKNAIANELFLELTAWLHNTIRGDTKYLAWAKAEWNWLDNHSGMISKTTYLVSDGPSGPGEKGSCVNTSAKQGQKIWTYNQGVILAGLAQLYTATKNRAYLTEAERIANAAISHLTVKGVLTELCKQNGCGTGSQSFKGIFIRDLKAMAVIGKTTAYNSFFTKQAQSIEAKDTNTHHQLGMFWAGPIADLTSYSQASALDALVASLKLP
jgi:Glycosyl hydrolase family 76